MLNKNEQILLLEMLKNGRHNFRMCEIRFKNQNIYRFKSTFFTHMMNLKNKGLVDSRLWKDKSTEKVYSMTFKGYVRANLIALDENNGSVYSSVGNPDIVKIVKMWLTWIG